MAKTTANKAAKAPAKKAAAKPAAEKKACAKACAKPAAEKKPAAKPAAAKKPVAKPAAAKKAVAEFVADCPLATTVSVAGTFNNWAVDKTMLKKDKKTGLWIVKISLPAGDYEYKFVCDGKNWDAGDNKIKHV
jgi:1,4-alpha-glucan branching enzyme